MGYLKLTGISSGSTIPNPLPITATDLDIRNLNFADDKADVSGSSVSIDNYGYQYPLITFDTGGTDKFFIIDTLDYKSISLQVTKNTYAGDNVHIETSDDQVLWYDCAAYIDNSSTYLNDGFISGENGRYFILPTGRYVRFKIATVASAGLTIQCVGYKDVFSTNIPSDSFLSQIVTNTGNSVYQTNYQMLIDGNGLVFKRIFSYDQNGHFIAWTDYEASTNNTISPVDPVQPYFGINNQYLPTLGNVSDIPAILEDVDNEESSTLISLTKLIAQQSRYKGLEEVTGYVKVTAGKSWVSPSNLRSFKVEFMSGVTAGFYKINGGDKIQFAETPNPVEYRAASGNILETQIVYSDIDGIFITWTALK